MFALLLVGAAVAFLWALVMAADWLAREWWITILALSALSYGALWLWHRRRIRELESRTADTYSRYRRHNRATSWPRYCQECGTTVSDWRQLNRHNDHHDRLEALEKRLEAAAGDEGKPIPDDYDGPIRLPAVSTVIRQGKPGGTGAVDTMLPGPDDPAELEAG